MTRRRPALFLDTGMLLAVVLPRDPDHTRAAEVLHRLARGEWTAAHTSDYVVAEALNFLRMKVKRQPTAEALHTMVFGSDELPPMVANVHRVHAGRFARALDRYRREFPRGLSFTDWTTVATMEDVGEIELATFDPGFRGVVKMAEW